MVNTPIVSLHLCVARILVDFSVAPPARGSMQQMLHQSARSGLSGPSHYLFDSFGQPIYASGAVVHNDFAEISADDANLEDYARMLDSAFNTLRRYVSCFLLSFFIEFFAGRVDSDDVACAWDAAANTDAASGLNDACLARHVA